MTALPAKAALLGEVLGEGDSLRLVVASHPLRNERMEADVPAGLSVTEIIAIARGLPLTTPLGAFFHVSINGHPVEPAFWPRVRPRAGTTLVIRATLEGPLVAGIGALFGALSAAAASISAFISGLGFVGKLIGLGLSLGAQFLLNALFPARQPQLAEQDTSQPKQGYSLTGSRNEIRKWEAVPVLLGRHRITPPKAAGDYTESDSEDQFLRLLFCLGYGPLAFEKSDIKIGETDLSSFQDYRDEIRYGYPGDDRITIYPAQVVEEPLSVELKQVDGWQRRTTAEDVDEISVDIVFPNGVHRIEKFDGRRLDYEILVRVRYRPVAGGDWVYMPDVRIKSSTLDTRRMSTRATVARGQYEVEVEKASSDHQEEDEDRVQETTVWSSLRGLRNEDPITFDHPLSLIALRIRATSQLSGTLDTLNVVATSRVTAWNGSAWIDNQPSQNPADLFRHVLQMPANPRPVPDEEIDLPTIERWHAYCASNNFRFCQYREDRASPFDVAQDIAAAGRATVIFPDGKWSVVWDEVDAPEVAMFTPANSWGFESEINYDPIPHGLRVRFINEEKGWREDERIVYDDGYTKANATLFETLEFPGVTDPAAIWKHGRFHLAQLRLRPERITIRADWEHLVLRRGDRVRLQHDVALIGLGAGRVVSVTGSVVRLDEPVTMEAGKAYQVRFRLADGTLVLRAVATVPAEETYSLTLTGTGSAPSVGDLFAFGEVSRETSVYRVLSIDPEDMLVGRLTLVDDAPAISGADKGAIPPFESNISEGTDLFHRPPRDLRITQRLVSGDAGASAALHLSWSYPQRGQVAAVEVEHRIAGLGTEPWTPTAIVPWPTLSADTPPLADGIYAVRARSVFADGIVSAWVSPGQTTIDSLTPPPDVTNLRLAVLGAMTTLSWDGAAFGAGLTYEVRFVPIDSVTVEWNAAIEVVPPLSGTSVQVPTMVGTYLVKARSLFGVRSRNAALARTTIGALSDINVVETISESPTFGGVKDGVVVENETLRLTPNNVIARWEFLSDISSLAAGDGDDDTTGFTANGTYLFQQSVDLGAVYTSRLAAQIEAFGASALDTMSLWARLSDIASLEETSPDDWSVVLQYRTTDVDPALNIWSSWAAVVVGDVTARAFQFRLILSGRSVTENGLTRAVVTPVVTSLRVVIDMPDRVLAREDVVVPVEGLRIDFVPAFIALAGIATADQDLMPGDRKTITEKGPSGFSIQFFDEAGNPVERTIDFVAKGHGNKLS